MMESCRLSLQMSSIFFMKKEVITPAGRGGGGEGEIGEEHISLANFHISTSPEMSKEKSNFYFL